MHLVQICLISAILLGTAPAGDPSIKADLAEIETFLACKDNTPKTYTRCQALTLVLAGIQDVLNATAQISEELDVLRGRQAVAVTIAVVQLTALFVYLVVILVIVSVKKCRETEAKRLEDNLEMMKERLAQRKRTARRKASRPGSQEQ